MLYWLLLFGGLLQALDRADVFLERNLFHAQKNTAEPRDLAVMVEYVRKEVLRVLRTVSDIVIDEKVRRHSN